MSLAKAVKTLLKQVLTRLLVIPFLRAHSERKSGIEDIVDLAFTFHNKLWMLPKKGRMLFSIAPAQIPEEIGELLRILEKARPQAILEIGTATGGTLFLLCRVACPGASVISIDLPGGRFGGGYSHWRVPLYKSFPSGRGNVFLLRRDSHDPNTLKAVRRIMHETELDVLFIDGDHSYEGVKLDFEMYSPLLRKGGIVAFHDIVKHPYETGCQVERFWLEVKNEYKSVELVNDYGQQWGGIGVLEVGGNEYNTYESGSLSNKCYPCSEYTVHRSPQTFV